MRKIIFASFLMLACVVGKSQNTTQLKFDKLVNDYGTLVKTDKLDDVTGDCVFNVTNIGNTPLIISKCTPSCGCTTSGCPKEPVLPGKTVPITIHFNANKVGPFTKSITIFSNTANSPVSLTIKGNVVENTTEPSK